MRKFTFLLIAALLITIPAFAIGNQPVAVSPTLVAAGSIETTQLIERTPAENMVTSKRTEEHVAERVESSDMVPDEITESSAPTHDTPETVATPATQPATTVVKANPAITAAVPTQVVAPVETQETVIAPAPVAVTTIPPAQAQATPAAPVVTAAPVATAAPASVVAVAPSVANDRPLIDVSKAQQGIVTINYSGTAKARLEVRKGDVKYYYNLYARQDSFPLQLGSGQYTITVFENTTDSKYRAADRSIVEVALTSANSVFLASIQEIKWSENSQAVTKARQLTAGLSTNRAKFEALYRFVVDNIDYDTPKLATLTSTYLPNIDTTLSTGKGICYDHASLLAAMLRSQGIPTKMVKGYATTVQGYHAWNEVYVDGQWLIIDASVDAQRRARGAELTMVKTSAVYSKTLEF